MERITRNQIDQLLKVWSKKVGGKVASSYKDVGGYQIGSAYGGYRIEKIVNEGGGIQDISPRLTKRELFDFMHAGIHAVDELHCNTGQ